MSDEPARTQLLPETNPAEAYALDVARLNRGSGSLGANDDAWLLLAHALHRLGAMSPEDRQAALPRTADSLAVHALSVGLTSHSMVIRAARALLKLHDPDVVLESGYDAITELVVSTQGVAEEQELIGASGLAYATLNGLLHAFSDRMPPRLTGNLLSQQGRAVRQLGFIDCARDLYEDAMRLGYECEAVDVVARALLGLGVLALTRGNYPSARELFERALLNSDRAGDPELIRHAHHGLLNCGLASGDLDSAMVHGWNVLRLCIAPDSRAEALMNMAEICRLTGEHESAIRVYTVAMEWTSQRRVRVHALSAALQSAIAIQRLSVAHRYRAELDELLPTVSDTYTRTAVGIELADSLQKRGDSPAAASRLEEALALATRHAYHELVHRGEQAASLWRASAPVEDPSIRPVRRSRPVRSEHFRTVLRSLNGLTATAR
ncbi:MAG TPA: hypothetical protein VE861_03455 [Gemmatimonadaceae bacterium]|nr:hypothetical protein [Gemmatimonadaceae bacterium]